MTTVLLVRHGQTEWNRVERFRGRADPPLNETGVAQAEATGSRIAREWRPVAVFYSPLSRAEMTAKVIARHCGLTAEAYQDLVDIDYGEWQGLTPDEARKRWPEEVEAWYKDPQRARIPGGETLDRVRVRTMEAVNDVAAHYPQDTVVVVSHTVTNRAILMGVLSLRNHGFWRLGQEPCAINLIEGERGDYTLVSMNDTCHLPRPQAGKKARR